jgi:polysaccharide pyruvyl transferase CsaB
VTTRRRIAISGYYGFDNAGDEAVLAGIVRSLRQIGSDAVGITALSIDPARTSADHGVAAAHRYRPASVLRTLLRSDLLLSGGGSLFQDVTSAHGIFYYAAVVRAAQILGRKTMFIAQGVGPLTRPRSRRLVAGLANRLDAITVRDTESKGLLEEIGVTRRIEVTADPALLLARSTVAEGGSRKDVVVSLRPWEGVDGLAERTAEACARCLSGYNIATLAMQPGKDAGTMEQFAARLVLRVGGAVEKVAPVSQSRLAPIVDALCRCRFVVGMRLHALIIAAGAGVPAVALAYDPKIGAFMRSTGQDDAVCALDISDAAFEELLGRMVAGVDARRENLGTRLPALRDSALRNAQIALELI